MQEWFFYGEAAGVAQLCGLGAQHAREDRVKGTHPKVACFTTHKLDDALFHLVGGFVGKSQSQDMEWINPQLHQVGYAVGQRARLAAAGAGDNHHGAVGACRRLALRFIQLVKQFTHFLCRI